jgi:hypothetical protein
MTPRVNGLAMICPPESGLNYLTFADDRFWKFIDSVFQDLKGEIEPYEEDSAKSMLINYALVQPYALSITKNPMAAVDEKFYPDELVDAVSVALQAVQQRSFDSCPFEGIKFPVKRTTGAGYPKETPDGLEVTKGSTSVSRRADIIAGLQRTRYRRDERDLKLMWTNQDNGCRRIFDMQLEASTQEPTPPHVVSWFSNNLCSVTIENARLNNGDPPTNAIDDCSAYADLVSKDRDFSVTTSEGLTYGLLDNAKVNRTLRNESHMPGLALKGRKICGANFPSQVILSGWSRMVWYDLEHGPNSFPSANERVVAQWRNAYNAVSDTHTVKLLTGDCRNAESTITQNWDLFVRLYPEDFRGIMRLMGTCVTAADDGKLHAIMGSLRSGVFFTSDFNMRKGILEVIRLTHALSTKNNLQPPTFWKYAADYCNALYSGGMWVDCGDMKVHPQGVTDDILMQIAVPRGVELRMIDDSELTATRMSCEVVDGPVVKFGMKATPSTLETAQSSGLAKWHHFERMGFSIQDAARTGMRIRNCGHTEVINSNLKRFFGVGYASYSSAEDWFVEFLKDYGLHPTEFFNNYSPSENLEYGDLISEWDLTAESVVPDETKEKFLSLLRNNFFRRKYETEQFA